MNEPRTVSSPLAAAGAVLALLALVGLAHGFARSRAEPAPAPAPSVGEQAPEDGGAGQVSRLLAGRPMDVNRATAEELTLLPRIGPTLAARIVEERARGGPFSSLEDLARVRGIGPRTIERLATLATASAPDAGAPP